MGSSWGGPNYEENFQNFVGGVNNQDFDCILWRDENYNHQTKHDDLFVEQKAGMDSIGK